MTTIVCPCGRPNHLNGKKAIKCKCGRALTVRIQEPRGARRRRKFKPFVKKKTGQTIKSLQGLFMGAGFVVLVITAIALVSMAGR